MWTQECFEGEAARASDLAPVHGGDVQPRRAGGVELLPPSPNCGASITKMSQGAMRLLANDLQWREFTLQERYARDVVMGADPW